MNMNVNAVSKLALFSAVLTLSSCATLTTLEERIPGLDRILHHFSKAEVGPVKTEDGEVIAGTETEVQPEVASNLATQTAQRDLVSSPAKPPAAAKSNESQAKSPTKVIAKQQSETAKESLAKEKLVKKDVLKPRHEAKTQPKKNQHVLSGNIQLLAKSGPISPKGVIVRLKRADGLALQAPGEGQEHVMDMEKKIYAPGQMVIRKGDAVSFVNKDEIQHNVFSSSGANAFDLGTFGGGLQRAVRLNEEGVVKVYCNIHPKMAAFVAVDDSGISQVVEAENGFFEFTALPPGEYTLTLWSVRGEQQQTITLTQQKHHLELEFDTSSYEAPQRTNKFGENYQKKRVRREYY